MTQNHRPSRPKNDDQIRYTITLSYGKPRTGSVGDGAFECPAVPVRTLLCIKSRAVIA